MIYHNKVIINQSAIDYPKESGQKVGQTKQKRKWFCASSLQDNILEIEEKF